MKLVGKAIKDVVLKGEVAEYIGTRFYNALAPQAARYPLVVGKVTGVEPVDYKASPNNGMACTDMFYYNIMCYSFDSEEAATIASKMRKTLDRVRPGPYKNMQLNIIRFLGAEENADVVDKHEVFSWELSFEIRVDYSTDDI